MLLAYDKRELNDLVTHHGTLACVDASEAAIEAAKRGETPVTVAITAPTVDEMAAKGYPGDYRKGTEIRNLDKAAALPDVTIFHAGTQRAEDGRLLAAGGRVLGVTALGPSVAAAQNRAYEAVDQIDWPDGFCRRDIGAKVLK